MSLELSCVWLNAFITITVLCNLESLKESVPSSSFHNTSSSNLQHRRAFHTELFRRFAFPPGTFLIVEPELTVPAWREAEKPLLRKSAKDYVPSTCQVPETAQVMSRNGLGESDVAITNAAIQIASPFYVYFDKLGWTHENSIYNAPQNLASYLQEYLLNPTLQVLGVPPRSVGVSRKSGNADNLKTFPKSSSAGSRRSSLSDLHRMQLFHKIESLLQENGVENGRACLLRAICEAHEFPFDTGRFGILGEVLALVLSVVPSHESKDASYLSNPCLNVYSRAEKQGKERNCARYTKYCPHSLFHWYWKMNHQTGVM